MNDFRFPGLVSELAAQQGVGAARPTPLRLVVAFSVRQLNDDPLGRPNRFLMYILALNLLWVFPVAVYLWARRESPRRVWQYTGGGLGLIIVPAAMGLYGFYFFSPFTTPLGILGLLLVLAHGEPGYRLAIVFNLVEPATVVRGIQHVYTEALAGLLWAPVYGAIGFALDWLNARKQRAAQQGAAAREQ